MSINPPPLVYANGLHPHRYARTPKDAKDPPHRPMARISTMKTPAFSCVCTVTSLGYCIIATLEQNPFDTAQISMNKNGQKSDRKTTRVTLCPCSFRTLHNRNKTINVLLKKEIPICCVSPVVLVVALRCQWRRWIGCFACCCLCFASIVS